MVTRKENIRPIIKEQMRGGDGRAVQTPVIDEAQFCGHGRLFAKMTLEPGCSIGWHEHHGESETFISSPARRATATTANGSRCAQATAHTRLPARGTASPTPGHSRSNLWR